MGDKNSKFNGCIPEFLRKTNISVSKLTDKPNTMNSRLGTWEQTRNGDYVILGGNVLFISLLKRAMLSRL